MAFFDTSEYLGTPQLWYLLEVKTSPRLLTAGTELTTRTAPANRPWLPAIGFVTRTRTVSKKNTDGWFTPANQQSTHKFERNFFVMNSGLKGEARWILHGGKHFLFGSAENTADMPLSHLATCQENEPTHPRTPRHCAQTFIPSEYNTVKNRIVSSHLCAASH